MTLLYVKDFFLFLCVFGFGYTLGLLTVLGFVAYFIITGNTVTIRKEDF